jgi:hypothetical protein
VTDREKWKDKKKRKKKKKKKQAKGGSLPIEV